MRRPFLFKPFSWFLRRTENQHVISPRFAAGIVMVRSLGTRQVAWHHRCSLQLLLGRSRAVNWRPRLQLLRGCVTLLACHLTSIPIVLCQTPGWKGWIQVELVMLDPILLQWCCWKSPFLARTEQRPLRFWLATMLLCHFGACVTPPTLLMLRSVPHWDLYVDCILSRFDRWLHLFRRFEPHGGAGDRICLGAWAESSAVIWFGHVTWL